MRERDRQKADRWDTGRLDRMSHRKWRETKQQPRRARSVHQISCCLVSLCDVLSGHPVDGRWESAKMSRKYLTLCGKESACVCLPIRLELYVPCHHLHEWPLWKSKGYGKSYFMCLSYLLLFCGHGARTSSALQSTAVVLMVIFFKYLYYRCLE